MLAAEELMIDDEICLNGDIRACGKVIELHAEEVLVMMDGDDACDIWGYEDISPVLLTPEHLETNKWKLDRSGYWDSKVYCYDVGKEVDVRVHFGDDGYMFAFGAICPVLLHYVHQFQHLLKDVGLAEIAKNFKI